MSESILSTKAPIGVIVVSIFVWFAGIVGMVHIGQALWRGFVNPDSVSAIGGYGIFFFSLTLAFIINVVILSSSSALTWGSNLARIIISISLLLHAVLSVLTIVGAQGDGLTLAAGWIALTLNVLGFLALAFVERDFFRE